MATSTLIAFDVIYHHILPLLSPRELLRLTLSCKVLLERLSYESVTRSVLLAGTSRGQTSLDNIIKLLRTGKIFVPSPIRLLRLTVSTSCELCGRKAYYPVREQYGILSCSYCLKESGRYTGELRMSTIRDSTAFGFAFHHERATGWFGRISAYVWIPDYVKAGRRCGPVITIRTVDRIRANNPCSQWSTKLHEFLSSGEAGKSKADSPDVVKIVRMYDDLQEERQQRSRQKRKRQAEKRVERSKVKQMKIESMKESVLVLLTSTGSGSSSSGTGSDKWWAQIAVESTKYAELTAKFRKAPSKITKKALKEVVAKLTTHFECLPTDFLSFNFLSTEDRFESALREVALAGCWDKLLKRAYERFFELVRAGHLKEAVLRECKVLPVFLAIVKKHRSPQDGFDQTQFAHEVWRHINYGAKDASQAQLRFPWHAFCWDNPCHVEFFTKMAAQVDRFLAEYDRAMAAACRYMSLDWLIETGREEMAERLRKHKSSLYCMAWVKRGMGMSALLKDPPDFDSLLRQHGRHVLDAPEIDRLIRRDH